jgi:aminoglycoside phosphotransferase (APT) family kinase protein
MCQSLIDTLADLHAIDPREAGLSDLGKPEGYVRRQIEGWTKRYHAAQTHEIPEMDAVERWLAVHMPAESGVSLVHNDFKFDNVAFHTQSPARVSTVFDWEMATLGDPLMDLGTTLGYWVEAGGGRNRATVGLIRGSDVASRRTGAQRSGGTLRPAARPGVV